MAEDHEAGAEAEEVGGEAEGRAVDDALAQIAADLSELGIGHALVGGLAVSVRGEPRFTRDADLALSVKGDAEAEALIFELVGRGYRVDASVEQTKAKRLATARLVHEGTDVYVDLLFASSGIERELVGRAEKVELVPGLSLPVASIGDLLSLKVLSRNPRRPQDDQDLRALLRVAKAADKRRAAANLRLIASRGYARRKNLLAEWARVQKRFGPQQ